MEWLLILIAGAFVFWGSVVLPWLNKGRIGRLENEIFRLQNIIDDLKYALMKSGGYDPKDILEKTVCEEKAPEDTKVEEDAKAYAAMTAKKAEKVSEEVWDKEPEKEEPKTKKTDKKEKAEDKKEEKAPKKPLQKTEDEPASWESKFGARLPVWLGGIALAFSGIFLVKYSIENGLLTPEMRIGLGLISGIVLLAFSQFLRVKKPDLANGVRITQALTGAGIVVLYAAIFAGTSLYKLVPMGVGFSGMALVTGVAVFLSLRHGAPIAMLGLVGGFATPTLIGSDSPSAATLFIYLYFVFAGLFFVVQREGWWKIAFLTVAASFLWVIAWIDRFYVAGDSIWLCLFLLATSGTVLLGTWKHDIDNPDQERGKHIKSLNYFAGGVAVLLMANVLDRANFGMLEWGMFGLLSAASLLLAWGRPSVYQKAPYISFVVNALLFLGWATSDLHTFGWTLAAFAAMYIGGSYVLLMRTSAKVLWSGLLCASSFIYFFIAYANFEGTIVMPAYEATVWGGMSLALASAMVYLLVRLQKTLGRDYEDMPRLQALYGISAMAFLAMGTVIILDEQWWALVAALNILAVSWISIKIDMPALRKLIKVLVVGFCLLMWPVILLSFTLMGTSIVSEHVSYSSAMKFLSEYPLLQIGIPGLCLVGAGHFLRRADDLDNSSKLIKFLEISGLVIVIGAVYYYLRGLFQTGESILSAQAGFIERGTITAVALSAGLAYMFAGRKYQRMPYSTAGIWVASFAMLRVIYFDLFMHNPYTHAQFVGNTPIANALWLNYVLPIIGGYMMREELLKLDIEKGTKMLHKIMLLLALAFVTLQVRHFYHHPYLNEGLTGNAEIYTYSVVWLLTGITILVWGIVRQNVMLRYAALVVVGLAVGKVFLYDTSELEGLYRVFSFFGLGVSLIGLSYVYTRFVLEKHDKKGASS